MKKRCLIGLRVSCFLILLFSVLYYFSNVFTMSEFHEFPGRNGFFQTINAENENTIDVMFVGDSSAQNAIIPVQIWKEQKITSYVLSYSMMKPQEAYFDLKKTFEKQSPKVVFLEASFLVTNTSENFDYFTENVHDNVDYIGDQISGEINYYLPISKYKSEWKNRTISDFINSHSYKINNVFKGYIYSNDTIPVPEDFEQNLDGIVKFKYSGDKYFKKILDLCNKNNSKLILFNVPHATSWNIEKHNFVSDLVHDDNVEYIDYHCQMEEYIPNFSWKTDTKDAGAHLNYSGACKLSNVIGNYLSNNLHMEISYLTSQETDKWDNDAYSFYRRIKK